MKYNDNGLVIYEGKSMLDKSTEIIAVLTGVISPSKNAKTGDMAQLWIMVKDVNPFTAIQTGEDNVVCGDCPLRGKVCYVNTSKAPLKIWEAYQKGRYRTLKEITWAQKYILRMKSVRLGAYGDPAALPQEVIESVIALTSGYTGYTHQWRSDRAQWLKKYCLASVETIADKKTANKKGWYTFRVGGLNEERQVSECPCLNSETTFFTCSTCRRCAGKTETNVFINVHGAKHNLTSYDKLRKKRNENND